MPVRYVIATEGLTKYYGRVKALENLNLRIEKGRFVGLLGPNGAGKTTTIKLLCGMLRPTRGRAFVLGLDPFRERCEVLARVGALVESPNFYQELTAEEILEYAGRLRGMYGRVLRERVCEVLEIVGLRDHARKRVRAFSRGMLQRLAIAQALLHDPDVLLLDEPASGLDPAGMREVRKLLHELCRDRTVLYASHLLHEVRALCSHVALIHEGRLLVYESVEELERRITTVRVEAYLLERPNKDVVKRVKEYPNIVSASLQEEKLVIDIEGDEHVRASILRFLVEELGLSVYRFTEARLLLEDVYVKLVEES